MATVISKQTEVSGEVVEWIKNMESTLGLPPRGKAARKNANGYVAAFGSPSDRDEKVFLRVHKEVPESYDHDPEYSDLLGRRACILETLVLADTVDDLINAVQ